MEKYKKGAYKNLASQKSCQILSDELRRERKLVDEEIPMFENSNYVPSDKARRA